MSYIILAYSILLMVSAILGYKNRLGISFLTLLLNLFLFLCTLYYIVDPSYNLSLILSILLISISVNLLIDRKKIGEEIHYSHHVIRFVIHVLFIYYLLG